MDVERDTVRAATNQLQAHLDRLTGTDGLPGALVRCEPVGGAPGRTPRAPARRGTDQPMVGADARFRIGSITKTFVAVTVLQLVPDLDAPVERYLPGLVRGTGAGAGIDGRRITVRQLLRHTSGLPDYGDAVDWARVGRYRDQDYLNLAAAAGADRRARHALVLRQHQLPAAGHADHGAHRRGLPHRRDRAGAAAAAADGHVLAGQARAGDPRPARQVLRRAPRRPAGRRRGRHGAARPRVRRERRADLHARRPQPLLARAVRRQAAAALAGAHDGRRARPAARGTEHPDRRRTGWGWRPCRCPAARAGCTWATCPA